MLLDHLHSHIAETEETAGQLPGLCSPSVRNGIPNHMHPIVESIADDTHNAPVTLVHSSNGFKVCSL
jgi:hypothetical protein